MEMNVWIANNIDYLRSDYVLAVNPFGRMVASEHLLVSCLSGCTHLFLS